MQRNKDGTFAKGNLLGRMTKKTKIKEGLAKELERITVKITEGGVEAISSAEWKFFLNTLNYVLPKISENMEFNRGHVLECLQQQTEFIANNNYTDDSKNLLFQFIRDFGVNYANETAK